MPEENQDQSPEDGVEAEARAYGIEMFTKAFQRMGWDTRFQEPAAGMAEKLANAIDQVQAEEGDQPA